VGLRCRSILFRIELIMRWYEEVGLIIDGAGLISLWRTCVDASVNTGLSELHLFFLMTFQHFLLILTSSRFTCLICVSTMNSGRKWKKEASQITAQCAFRNRLIRLDHL
jgi:hypothetical protein